MATTCALDKPLVARIHSGKRTTYIDDEIKAKKYIPAADYKVQGDLNDKKHKSSVNKAARKTMADDIASFQKKNKFPGPNVHNPDYASVHKRNSSCLSFKGERVGFL